jgi:hypothetical protein
MSRNLPRAFRTTRLLAWCTAVVLLGGAGGTAWAQGGCLEFVPPLLFGGPGQIPPDPDVPARCMGIDMFTLGGHRYLIHNLGNDLEIVRLDDPLDPGPPVDSSFGVPPWGDRDYNLFNFTVCDECRYGVAAFDTQGRVLFDLGTGQAPSFATYHYYADAPGRGAFTFMHGTQQYLVSSRVQDVCESNDALFAFNGVDPTDLLFLQCVTDAPGDPVGTLNGFSIPGSTSYVYLVTTHGRVEMYQVTGSGTDLRLQPLGWTIGAGWLFGRGIDLDLDAPPPFLRLAVSAGPSGVQVWDLYDPGAPVVLSQWDPNPGLAMRTVAIEYPHVWVGADWETTTAGSTFTYDISDPSSPQGLDPGFWYGSNPWSSYPGSVNVGAVFTADSEWLFLSRSSVLERIHFCQFADGFESGSPSAWSLAVP